MSVAPSLGRLTAAAVLFGAAGASANSMIFALLAIIVPEDRRSSTFNLIYAPLYLAGIVGGLGALPVHGGLTMVVLAGAGRVFLAALLTKWLVVSG